MSPVQSMQHSIAAFLVFFPVLSSAFPHLYNDAHLNTMVNNETPEQRAYRSRLLQTIVPPFPPGAEEQEPSVNEIYNPMEDARCFNDFYNVPDISKNELYDDFVKIFKWGLANPEESPLFDFSSTVTNNRFPGFCLRMAFHDNAIVGQSLEDYVRENINPDTRDWEGDTVNMTTSGADGSVLVCKAERLHPNQNYDQTASRVLYAFQTGDAYPRGPGIMSGGTNTSLISKYGLSYADLLHNCALSAVKFLTEPGPTDPPFDVELSTTELNDLSTLVDRMEFGRRDACVKTNKRSLLLSPMEYDNKVPLCGPTEILPGVNLNATQIVHWFESRGMKVGAWVSLFGTHTTMDNFMDPKVLRSFGIPDEDYFEDYIGCPVHKVSAFVSDPESSGCDWTPQCKTPTNTEEQRWPMVRSDCATGIDIVASTPGLGDFEDQIRVYMERTGSWLPDLLCGLKHLGGRGEDCVGPNSVVPRDDQRSLFGGFYDYVVRPDIGCGTAGTCKLVDLTTGEERLLASVNIFQPIVDHDYTVECDAVGKIEHSKFYYDGGVTDDHGGKGFFMGGNVNDDEPERPVEFLKAPGVKVVKFEGYIWSTQDPCFDITFTLQVGSKAVLPTLAPTKAPTLAPTKAPTLAPTKAPTVAPTKAPTLAPTNAPTLARTKAPTLAPTKAPTLAPTKAPTLAPTNAPITGSPTEAPVASTVGPAPTSKPSKSPSRTVHRDCGTAGTCKLVDLTTGTERILDGENVFEPILDHDYTVECDGVGKVDHSKFYYNGRITDDHGGNGFFMGGNVNDDEPERPVEFLKAPGLKVVKFEGYVWRSNDPCFEITFALQVVVPTPPVHRDCGTAGTCKLLDLTTGTERILAGENIFSPVLDHDYTVECDGVGKVDHSKFYYDGRITDDHGGNGFFMGGNVNDNEPERPVEFLKAPGIKVVKFEGYVWRSNDPCFEIMFTLQVGGKNVVPTPAPVNVPTALPTNSPVLTGDPVSVPTTLPTNSPVLTGDPVSVPTALPTNSPLLTPIDTVPPVVAATGAPTESPMAGTIAPSTQAPAAATTVPSTSPTVRKTFAPTVTGGLGRPVLDADGNPIGREECGSFGSQVNGFPCSPFTLTPFQEVFTTTAAFNPAIRAPTGEVCREDGHCAMVFEFDMVGVELELFNNVLTGCEGTPTKLISFHGSVPSETLMVASGKETYVQFNNKITQEATPRPEMYNGEGCTPLEGKEGVPVAIHNHGQASLAPFDGYAEDRICLDETKAYMFPNNRPTTGWFHDHALHQTTENVMHGLLGLYVITEKTSFGGCGDPYNLDEMEEVHLVMNDYVVTDTCQIYWDFEGPHDDDYYGDINLVNGHPFPTLASMQRKWYRFRTLNASVSRPLLLRLLTPDGSDVSAQFCQVIAADGGYLELGPQPFPELGLVVAVAERWEFVCDFSQLDASVSTLILHNGYTDAFDDVPYFTFSNYVAKFVFDGASPNNAPVFDPNDRGNIGNFSPTSVLEEAIPIGLDMVLNGQSHRTFDFNRGGGLWTINGETWDSNRIAADDVGQNTWELWEIDSGGGWFHPVHVHLIDFFILARESDQGVLSFDSYGMSGAPKDVMLIAGGDKVYVIARFGPHRGEYMLHCHNLVHEDHDMLRTYIIAPNTNDAPGGRNAGNLDAAFTEVNGIIYDEYAFAEPTVGILSAIPTDEHPPAMVRAQEFVNNNFYRIFYPLPGDDAAVLNNPWIPPQCPAV